MFIYGEDIPLQDVVSMKTQSSNNLQPTEKSLYPFTYGQEIFQEEKRD